MIWGGCYTAPSLSGGRAVQLDHDACARLHISRVLHPAGRRADRRDVRVRTGRSGPAEAQHIQVECALGAVADSQVLLIADQVARVLPRNYGRVGKG